MIQNCEEGVRLDLTHPDEEEKTEGEEVEKSIDQLADYEHELIRLSLQLEKIKKGVRELVKEHQQNTKLTEAALNMFDENMDTTISAVNRSIYDLDSICWFML